MLYIEQKLIQLFKNLDIGQNTQLMGELGEVVHVKLVQQCAILNHLKHFIAKLIEKNLCNIFNSQFTEQKLLVQCFLLIFKIIKFDYL